MIFPPSATATQRSASHAEVALQTEPTRSFSLTLRDAQECEKTSVSSKADEQITTKKPDAKKSDDRSADDHAEPSPSAGDASSAQASDTTNKSHTNKAKADAGDQDADDASHAAGADLQDPAAAEDTANDASSAAKDATTSGEVALVASLLAAPTQPVVKTAGAAGKSDVAESSQITGPSDTKTSGKSADSAAIQFGAGVTPSAALTDGGDTSGQSQDSSSRKEKSLAATAQSDATLASSNGVPIPQSALIDANATTTSPASIGATPTAEAIGSQQPTQSQGTPSTPAFAAAPSLQPATAAQDWSEQAEENISRVTRGIQAAVQQNGGSVTLRVSPPDLGMVRVQMHIESGMVRAEIVAQHESVSSLLSRELGQLKNALEGQGLVVDRLSVTTMSATPPTSQSNGSSSWQAGEDGRSRGQFERDGRDQPSQRRQNDGKTSEFERAMLNLVA